MLMKLQSRLPLHWQLMCHRRGQDGLVSWVLVPEGPLIGYRLGRTSSQWSGSGLRRTRRLLIKKLPGLSSTTRGPSTIGTFPSHTCAIFTPTASVYWQWLKARNTPSPSPLAWIRGLTSTWQSTGCIYTTMFAFVL